MYSAFVKVLHGLEPGEIIFREDGTSLYFMKRVHGSSEKLQIGKMLPNGEYSMPFGLEEFIPEVQKQLTELYQRVKDGAALGQKAVEVNPRDVSLLETLVEEPIKL